MSDSCISIVPKLSTYPNKFEKSKEIIAWLISIDAIKPALSDCTLGSEGYAISNGANHLVNDKLYLPYNLNTNGLEVIIERQVFDTGENGIDELICPSCNENISGEDWNMLDEWHEQREDQVTCPLCKEKSDIQKFKFTPEWGFSDLGFSFWNWPELKEAFVDEFKQRLDCNISIVYQHL